MIQKLSYGVKIPMYLLAAFLPLLFLPVPWAGDFGREIVFSALVLVAVAAWLVRTLASGEARYVHSPILYAAGALALAAAASALLSHAPFVSVFFADAAAERVSWLIIGILLMIAASSALRRREEAGTTIFILIFSGATAAAIAAVQMLFGFSLFAAFGAGGIDSNVIGTVNGAALFFAALGMMAAGMLVSPAARAWKAWVRWALGGAAALFLLDMMLINFFSAWCAVLGASVLLFGLLLMERNAPDIARSLGASPRGDMGTGIVPPSEAAISASGQQGAFGTMSHGYLAGQYRATSASGHGIGTRHWVAIAIVILSLLMIMMRGSVLPLRTAFPAEVSPSFSATLSIAGSLFKEGPVRVFFGSGPGTFGILWEKYKDVSINQTIFWGVRFTQGQSWAATLLATTGLLGGAGILIFLGIALITFLRALLAGHRVRDMAGEDMPSGADALGTSVFLGFAVLLIGAFLYPANVSLVLLLFFTAGLLSLVLTRRLPAVAPDGSGEEQGMDGMRGEDNAPMIEELNGSPVSDRAEFFAGKNHEPQETPVSFWDIRECSVRFVAPWSIFVSSLMIIFLLAGAAALLYEDINRAAAAWAAFDGIAAANKGDIDGALAGFTRAVAREPRDFHTLQALVQVRAAKIQQLIAAAAGGKNVQQDFQSAVSAAVQDSQNLAAMYPDEPEVWRTQGALYELMIPYIQGAERFATTAYQKAAERDPVNPAVYTDWGRAGLVFTDRILALENQTGIKDKDKEQLAQARKQNLEQIATIFQRAIQVKQDFAAAHFLLAQTALRLGNTDAAIASVENAKAAAPFDIGVAFQLGLLYYQKQDFGRAGAEMERAISLNENYSNARYFLGLIYDKKGDKASALEQFTKIAGLNPDNQEVKHIVDNLIAGKPALDGIVPPEPPPEKRRDAPIKEQEQKK